MLFPRGCSPNSIALAFLGTNLALQGGLLHAQGDGQAVTAPEPPAVSTYSEDSFCIMLSSASQLLSSSSLSSEQSSSAQQLRDSSLQLAHEISRYQGSTLSELSAVRSIMEQSILLPAIAQLDRRDDGVPRIDSALAALYDALLPKLLEGATDNTTNPTESYAELGKHYQHILRALRAAPVDVRTEYSELLVRHFIETQLVPACEIYADIANICGDDSDLNSKFLAINFAAVAESFYQRVERLATYGVGDTERTDYLLTLHQRVYHDLIEAQRRGYLPRDTVDQCLGQAQSTFVELLAPHLVTIWKLDHQSLAHFNRATGRDIDLRNPLSIEGTRYYPDRSTLGVTKFLSTWPGDRSIIGNLYFDALDSYSNQYQHRDVAGFLAINMLPLIAPEPRRKEYIIDDLRKGLLREGRQSFIGHTSDRPMQVARVLALSLISDHLYFATPANTSYDAKLALSLMRGLKDNQESLEPYRSILTPSQYFLLELFRVAKGGDVAASIPWASSGSEAVRSHLSNRAAMTLHHLMFNLYDCQPSGTLQDTSRYLGLDPIATPKAWGTAPIFPPAPGAEVVWRNSLQDLFSYADIIFESVVERSPRSTSIFFISSQISDVAEILWRRGGPYDRVDPSRTCQALLAFKELYKEPGRVIAGERGGSFFTELKRAIGELHNPVEGSGNTLGSHGDVQTHAHRYVDTLQRLSIAEFLVRELTSVHDPESTFSGPARRGLTTLCEQLGFIERDPKIKEILSLSNTETMLKESNSYAEELTATLSRLTAELGL